MGVNPKPSSPARPVVEARLKVDFVVGERRRPPIAMERCYAEVRSRVGPQIEGEEISYTLPLGLDRRLPAKYLSRMTFYSRIVRKKRRPGSVVHLHNQKLGGLLHRIDLSPCLVMCHDVVEHVLPEYRIPLVYKLYIHPYYTGTAKAELIVTPSQFTADEVHRHFDVPRERLRVIPNGVDHYRYRPGDRRAFLRARRLPEDRHYVLFVGSEQPRKELGTAVRAFLRARREIPRLHFLKVGSPDELPGHPERKNALKLLKESGATDAATFVGRVPEDQIPGAYAAADVLLFPSRYEGFGLPVLEAMACGTPVVCADSSSLPEVAGDAALMVPTGNEEAMAQGILRLAREKEFRENLVSKGLERAIRFDWDTGARAFLGLYRELAGRAK